MTHHLVFGTEDGWFNSNEFNAASSLQYLDPLVINGNAPVYGNVAAAIPDADRSSIRPSTRPITDSTSRTWSMWPSIGSSWPACVTTTPT